MTEKYKYLYIVISILAISILYNSCFTNSEDAKVIINLGSFNKSAALNNQSIIDKFLQLFATKAYAGAPSDVASIIVTVTGTNMSTIVKTYSAGESVITLKVPAGENRSFIIEAKDSSNILAYYGSYGPVYLHSGSTVNANITMKVSSWGRIYVANNGADNSVSVIDWETNSIVDTIAVGASPFGVGVNSVTNKIYVVNNADDTVSVIDGKTNTVIGGAIDVCTSCDPIGVGVNSSTNKIYIGTQYNSDTLAVIDGITNAVNFIDLNDCYPYGLAVNSNTNKVYAALWCGSVSIINGSTDTESSILDLGLTDPFDAGINLTTNKIYITRNGDDTVSVIDGSSDALVVGTAYPITVGGEPYGVDVNSDTNKVYVANNADNTVSVINSSTDIVIDTITVGSLPMGVAVNTTLNRIYIANSGDDTVSVIDGSTDTVIETITVGTSPAFIDVME